MTSNLEKKLNLNQADSTIAKTHLIHDAMVCNYEEMKSLVLLQHPSTKLHIYVLESSSTTEKSQELRIFLDCSK